MAEKEISFVELGIFKVMKADYTPMQYKHAKNVRRRSLKRCRVRRPTEYAWFEFSIIDSM